MTEIESMGATIETETPRGTDEGADFDPAPHRPTRRQLVSLAALAALLLTAIAAVGAIPRAHQRAVTEERAREASSIVPRVPTLRAQREQASGPVLLPGTVQPLQETAIYARANGYVRRWYVDIGAEVKQGQVLAELDLPDVDQELQQARASARQATASITQSESRLQFARTTNDRFAALAAKGVVSQQQTDQYSSELAVQRADLDAARAASGSADANVHRVRDLRGFGTLVAPFDGVVTLRSLEVGQLVVSGTGQGQPLFKVAEDDVVRVFVNVPQLYAGGVKPGSDAPVSVREVKGRTFPGKVARTSRELDPVTRALRVEIDVPNPDRVLVSGMFATVSVDVRRQDAPLTVPATAVRIDALGTRVALVQNGRVHWQTVDVRGDLGDRLMIAAGVGESDELVATPSDRLADGREVQAEGTP